MGNVVDIKVNRDKRQAMIEDLEGVRDQAGVLGRAAEYLLELMGHMEDGDRQFVCRRCGVEVWKRNDGQPPLGWAVEPERNQITYLCGNCK